jgi:hypothetical protein
MLVTPVDARATPLVPLALLLVEVVQPLHGDVLAPLAIRRQDILNVQVATLVANASGKAPRTRRRHTGRQLPLLVP